MFHIILKVRKFCASDQKNGPPVSSDLEIVAVLKCPLKKGVRKMCFSLMKLRMTLIRKIDDSDAKSYEDKM